MPQITIAGDVNLIGWEGRKLSVWENYESNGRKFSRLWTCWFEQSVADQVQELDWVEIKGELSTKIGAYTPKDSTVEKAVVEHHLNESKFVQIRSKAEQAASAASFEEMPF